MKLATPIEIDRYKKYFQQTSKLFLKTSEATATKLFNLPLLITFQKQSKALVVEKRAGGKREKYH